MKFSADTAGCYSLIGNILKADLTNSSCNLSSYKHILLIYDKLYQNFNALPKYTLANSSPILNLGTFSSITIFNSMTQADFANAKNLCYIGISWFYQMIPNSGFDWSKIDLFIINATPGIILNYKYSVYPDFAPFNTPFKNNAAGLINISSPLYQTYSINFLAIDKTQYGGIKQTFNYSFKCVQRILFNNISMLDYWKMQSNIGPKNLPNTPYEINSPYQPFLFYYDYLQYVVYPDLQFWFQFKDLSTPTPDLSKLRFF